MKKCINLVLIIGIVLIFFSCRRSESAPPSENLSENECNPGDGSIGIVLTSPYQDPIWHPKGKLIGFNHIPLKEINYLKGIACPFQATYKYDNDSAGFWLVNSDGSNKRRILSYRLDSPAWSPDGKWIVFSRSGQIYKMPFDGENFNTDAMVSLTSIGRNFFPAWSPDGKWIAYDSNSESSTGNYRVWKMDSSGNFKECIAELGTRMPTWTNDFEIIHLRYNGVETGGSGLYKMNIAGKNIIKLIDNVGYKRYPIALVNKIGFIADNLKPGDGTQLYILDSVSGEIKKLTEEGAISFSWGPYNKIVYASFNGDRIDETRGTLWTMNTDGSNKKPLTYNSMKIHK